MFKITAEEKRFILRKRAESKKFPDNEPLGIDVPGFDRRHLPRAESVGAISYIMPLFKKRRIAPIAGDRFKLGIKNDELYLVWTAKGKKTMRVRTKENPDYYEDVVGVIRDGYKKYFKELKFRPD